MSMTGWFPTVITTLRGMWSWVAEKRTGNPARASFMRNMRMYPGRIRSRPGTSSVGINSLGFVSSIYNWITPSERNLLLMQDGNQITSYDQVAKTRTVLGTTAATVTTFAELDIWNYIAGYDTGGKGTGQVKIYDGTNFDTAFRGPIAVQSYTAADAGPGQCSQGTHILGFTYQNRTGFEGPPITTFNGSQMSVNLSSDGRKITFNVQLPALSDAGGVSACYLVMSRANDPSTFYYIPTDSQTGSVGKIAVPAGGNVLLQFVANLSDADINASAISATSQFLLLTQDANGNGPITPSVVKAYGNRMCYVSGSVLYVSSINNSQQITQDQNTVRMPNQRTIGTVFQLSGSTSLTITGDRWTATVTDTTDIPATWAQPYSVSESLGAPFDNLVEVRAGSNSAWVVTESGPYLFNGNYGDRPLTYLVTDQWQRVNWAAAYTIRIQDNTTELKLYIAVPLDGATQCNAMFVIDYQAGSSYDEVDITLDTFTPVNFGSIGTVKELSTALSALWITPAAAGSPILRFDPTTVNDNGAAIDAYWESGLVRKPNQIKAQTIRCGPAEVWIRGNLLPTVTIYSLDRTQAIPSPLLLNASTLATTLSTASGQYLTLKKQMTKTEDFTIAFEMNKVDGWMEISNITAYVQAEYSNR